MTGIGRLSPLPVQQKTGTQGSANGKYPTEGFRLLIYNITHNGTGTSVAHITFLSQAMVAIISKCRWIIVLCAIGSILKV